MDKDAPIKQKYMLHQIKLNLQRYYVTVKITKSISLKKIL